mmetsp:Transcript_85295/g.151097  ORF Transcript_85295/g.151097 Transcript_85295/m.151097 type:complete len:274 (+) Transcript_85295:87-908(+)
MQIISLVLAFCLARAGYGRRVQSSSEHLSQSLAQLEGESKGRAQNNPFSKLFGEKESTQSSDEDVESTTGNGNSAEKEEGFDWERENLARFRAGEINDAELGIANLQAAMNDPAVLEEVAQMLRDPEYQAQLQKMMADPTFQQQAKQAAEQIKADPNYQKKIKKVMQQTKKVMEDDDLVAANIQKAMTDPSLLSTAMETLNDPEQIEQIKKMMADPEVQAMQKRMAEQMQAMISDPETAEQMQAMMADPKFQEQAKRIAEQMQGAIAEEKEEA